MKTLRPGDLIEWKYVNSEVPLCHDEKLWSLIENRWVPIGGDHGNLLIAYYGDNIVWLNDKGLFRAFTSDSSVLRGVVGAPGCVHRWAQIVCS